MCQMEGKEVIEPSSRLYAWPVGIVKKKDGSLSGLLDALIGSTFLSILNLKLKYCKVKMDLVDREKTALTLGTCLWYFTVMSFALFNVLVTFVRLMESVLRESSWKICVMHLDHIIVMEKRKSANMALGPKKCHPFQIRETYLVGMVYH